MVIREDKVAIEHFTTNPTSLKVGETHYSWTPRNNVSLCWVAKDDVNEVLKVKAKICCGKKKPRFFVATQKNVNIHEGVI